MNLFNRHYALAALVVMSIAVLPSSSFAKGAKYMKGQGGSKANHPKPNTFWWPDQLDLSPLRDHDSRSNPYGDDFNYAEEFSKINLADVKADVNKLLTDSQDWWPA